jgi:hypothetical protein
MTCVARIGPRKGGRRLRKQLILSALYRYGMALVWDGSRKLPSPTPGTAGVPPVLSLAGGVAAFPDEGSAG